MANNTQVNESNKELILQPNSNIVNDNADASSIRNFSDNKTLSSCSKKNETLDEFYLNDNRSFHLFSSQNEYGLSSRANLGPSFEYYKSQIPFNSNPNDSNQYLNENFASNKLTLNQNLQNTTKFNGNEWTNSYLEHYSVNQRNLPSSPYTHNSYQTSNSIQSSNHVNKNESQINVLKTSQPYVPINYTQYNQEANFNQTNQLPHSILYQPSNGYIQSNSAQFIPQTLTNSYSYTNSSDLSKSFISAKSSSPNLAYESANLFTSSTPLNAASQSYYDPSNGVYFKEKDEVKTLDTQNTMSKLKINIKNNTELEKQSNSSLTGMSVNSGVYPQSASNEVFKSLKTVPVDNVKVFSQANNQFQSEKLNKQENGTKNGLKRKIKSNGYSANKCARKNSSFQSPSSPSSPSSLDCSASETLSEDEENEKSFTANNVQLTAPWIQPGI